MQLLIKKGVYYSMEKTLDVTIMHPLMCPPFEYDYHIIMPDQQVIISLTNYLICRVYDK